MTAAITIHFREPALTARCVDSLLADGWMPILVWDNSEDGGSTLALLQKRYATDCRVRFAADHGNLGFGRGMNAALKELGVQGYVGPVLLVNNDAQVEPGLHQALMAAIQDDECPTIIAPHVQQDGVGQGWLYYNPWFALVTRRSLPGSFRYLSGCCILVHRRENAKPLFDEDFFMYGEDVELSWRMQQSGARLALVDGDYVRHEGSASTGQASEAYERFLVQSHWLLAEKLGGNAATRVVMRLTRVPALLLRASLRAWRYRSGVPLKALLEIRRADS